MQSHIPELNAHQIHLVQNAAHLKENTGRRRAEQHFHTPSLLTTMPPDFIQHARAADVAGTQHMEVAGPHRLVAANAMLDLGDRRAARDMTKVKSGSLEPA